MSSKARPSAILTINGGSSSLKFALFASPSLERRFSGEAERIGQRDAVLTIRTPDGAAEKSEIESADLRGAAERVLEILRERSLIEDVSAVGHRIVQGGTRLLAHQRITELVLEELRSARELDLAHLPHEIALIEAVGRTLPDVLQVACLDTAFHRDMPRVAQLLPIPRKYLDAGLRRLGFHGLSYASLLETLRRDAGDSAAQGRVVLAHLGSGSSLAAVHGGKPIDTTMGLTPAGGLVMGTRPGDLDPGLLLHLMRLERSSVDQMDELVNWRCGLAGVSDGTADMRSLLERRTRDPRAAEAVDLYVYQARKWIGAFAAALGGLETLVFSGGIGERSAEIRRGIGSGLEYLGLRLDEKLNAAGASIVSSPGSAVTVRVIATDEELVIARIVRKIQEEQ